jgi:hypothetical protein
MNQAKPIDFSFHLIVSSQTPFCSSIAPRACWHCDFKSCSFPWLADFFDAYASDCKYLAREEEAEAMFLPRIMRE